MFTSAYFTLTIPLIVFSRDVALFMQILPDLDAAVHYHSLQARCIATIVSCSTVGICYEEGGACYSLNSGGILGIEELGWWPVI